VLGAEHPDTANSLNNLAGLLYSQGGYDGARPLYERALAISEKVLEAERTLWSDRAKSSESNAHDVRISPPDENRPMTFRAMPGAPLPGMDVHLHSIAALCSRSAFAITLTEESDMAAAAITGDRRMPNAG
jgi:Tetratricopeptide repeat